MYQCKKCGGALIFDIASQKMRCPYCDNQYDPYSLKEKGVEETLSTDDYETRIFTCPQCGGQLGSVENSTAEFCSYCGSPAVLESRLCRVKKPDYIIPFQKTREDCKDALKASLKKAFFVPKDFRDCEIDKIRGIYMPYWNFNVTQKGSAAFRMTEDDSSNYDYEIHYKVSAHVDASYEGIPHDASSTFADELSESLEPYNYKKRQKFSTAFLSGFYADIQDVEESKYEKDAVNQVNQHTLKEFRTKFGPEAWKIKNESDLSLSSILHAELQKTDTTLIPVWFLSYRKNQRVAYAAVNGETGKVVSDMPLDIPKIWAVALLLAIPIFFLLNVMVSMRASTALFVSDCLLGITSALYLLELSMLEDREDPDKILFARAARRSGRIKKEEKKKKKLDVGTILKGIGCGLLLLIPAIILGAFLLVILILGLSVVALVVGIALVLVCFCILCCGVILPIYGIYKYRKKKGSFRGVLVGFVALLLASLLSAFILFKDPVSDLYFYGGVIANLLAILVTLIGVLNVYNKLATRPLPQFVMRGGDRNEK